MARQLLPGWAQYLRVSDEDKQSPERSFALQRDAIRRILLVNSELPLRHTYEDRLTGTNYDRENFQQMLDDARAGRFSQLAVYRVDRFGRDTAEGLTVAKELRELGVQVIPASNPGLDITTPDGWMLFTILLGLGEHEVGVLRLRTTGGMRAKLQSGHWCWRAPDGYKNCHREINAGKRESWLEQDPDRSKIMREAWDLLLTGEYSLEAICEELDRRGYYRGDGKRWVWINSAGKQQVARSTLSRIFHNPLHAGWIVAPNFGVEWGMVRSKAGAIVSDEEYHRAQQILGENNRKKRKAKHDYLLQGMIKLKLTPEETVSLHCGTTKRKGEGYPYYFLARHRLGIDANGLYLAQGNVDGQIPDLLGGIQIEPAHIPELRAYYARNICAAVEESLDQKLHVLRRRLTEYRENEKAYARLWAQRRLSDAAFDELAVEVRSDIAKAENAINQVKRGSDTRIRDLDQAVKIVSHMPQRWPQLTMKEQRQLLRLIFKEVHVNLTGQLLPSPLHAPFGYLAAAMGHITRVINDEDGASAPSSGSTCAPLGDPHRI